MGADIGALIGPELVVDAEDEALRIDRGADLVDLIARMVGREKVLAPVLDPLDRAPEAQRREARQDILGVELAANAEAAADVALVEMDALQRQTEHPARWRAG